MSLGGTWPPSWLASRIKSRPSGIPKEAYMSHKEPDVTLTKRPTNAFCGAQRRGGACRHQRGPRCFHPRTVCRAVSSPGGIRVVGAGMYAIYNHTAYLIPINNIYTIYMACMRVGLFLPALLCMNTTLGSAGCCACSLE